MYWIDLGAPTGSEPGLRRPYVVVQSNAFNHSRIQTVVVCAVTTNLERAVAPGNALLEQGEANLTQPSMVNVSQIVTVDKGRLHERIGTLSRERMEDIGHGIRLVTET